MHSRARFMLFPCLLFVTGLIFSFDIKAERGGRDQNILEHSVMSKGYPKSLTPEITPALLVRLKVAEIKETTRFLKELQSSRFSKPEDKKAIVDSFDDAYKGLSNIFGDFSSASDGVLRQSMLEADKLSSLLNESMKPDGSVDTSFKGEAVYISLALQERGNDIKNGGNGESEIKVHTLKKDGRPAPLLRVFFKPKLDDEIGKFGNLSTPTTKPLSVGADFILWAGEGDDPTPLTDEVPVHVYSTNNGAVTLKLKK